jgi:hypothetical protein
MKQHEVLQELKELDSPLAGLSRAMPYAVPEGYFAGLAHPALETARRADAVASVPAGYFQNLPQAMLIAAKASDASADAAKPRARIITLSSMQRWAAAAIMLLALCIGGSLLLTKSDSTPQEDIATLPSDAVQAYVAEHVDGVDVISDADASLATADNHIPQLSGVSDAELEAYLAEEGVLF